MSTPQLPITGGCFCGAIRYRATAAPLGVRTCWCRFCQYAAAGSATVNAIFARDAVTITGPMRRHERIADSGLPVAHGFCPTCGTQITSEASARPHLLVVRVGTLDDPGRAAPQGVIWAEAAPDWAVLDPALPHHAQQPPPVA